MIRYQSEFSVGDRVISLSNSVYFIADVASNHDGDLSRAKSLVWSAKEAGADCVKFQHFKAEKIVSDVGFRALGGQGGHQSSWKKSVFDTFRQYEFNREWNLSLAAEAKSAGIDFMTTPYDFGAVEEIDSLVPAYKIGSGDISWTEFLQFVAKKGKPMFLACGASNMEDVERAVHAVVAHNPQLCLMQCNTNYTGSLDNLRYVNLRVLESFRVLFPGMVLGLSDHTPGHATVLGAVALGARAVEKHFTDDNSRSGPDHGFSMNPRTWREMVDRSRELEAALGDGFKRVEANETETYVLQRRCLRYKRPVSVGSVLTEEDLEALRPAPSGALAPFEMDEVLGRKIMVSKDAGEHVCRQDFEVKR